MYQPSILGAIFLFTLMASSAAGQQTVKYDEAFVIAIRNTIIASEAPGIVSSLEVQTGDDVTLQQTLVALNRKKYEADLAVAIAEEDVAKLQAENTIDLKYARKTAEVNEKQLDRAQQARTAVAKSVSQTDVDRLRLELEQAQLSTQQAELDLKIAGLTAQLKERITRVAEIDLANRNVSAPFDGKVAQIYVQAGQWINAGEPIARLIDLKKLRVQGFFSKDHLRRIKKGSKAVFTGVVGNQQFEVPVTISFVGSELIEGRFQVWADVDNTDGILLPGLKGDLTVILEE